MPSPNFYHNSGKKNFHPLSRKPFCVLCCRSLIKEGLLYWYPEHFVRIGGHLLTFVLTSQPNENCSRDRFDIRLVVMFTQLQLIFKKCSRTLNGLLPRQSYRTRWTRMDGEKMDQRQTWSRLEKLEIGALSLWRVCVGEGRGGAWEEIWTVKGRL